MALAISSSSSSFFATPAERKDFSFSKKPKSSIKYSTSLTITASSLSSALPPMKTVRCPALDHHAAKHNHLRFPRKLTTLLLSKPKYFLPLRILSRCRAYLNPPPTRSLLSMIQQYPSLFTLFHAPSHISPSLSLLSVTLTPAAAALAADESRLRACITDTLAGKLHRLLMLAPQRRILLSKLVHIAPDLGLAPNFPSRLCNAQPSRFRVVDTSYGRALELASWDCSLVEPLPRGALSSNLIIERVPKFPQLRLRRGLNLRRRHREYLIRFQDLPEVNPYLCSIGDTPELQEKRACAVVREVVGMTTERRTLVDHLTHFRKELGLPNRLRAMLVRHPELFYVSVKGARDSVFLVDAYDEKGRLVVDDELVSVKERLAELVKEGKRMRRERRRIGYEVGVDVEEEEEVEDDDVDDDDDDDALEDLFEAGIGDDWDQLEEEGSIGGEDNMESDELWARKTIDLKQGDKFERKLEAW